MSYITGFSSDQARSVATVGGKGANLGALTAAGFRVPPGVTVTTDAYRTFIDRGDLGSLIRDTLARVDYGDAEGLERESAKIRAAIGEARMPEEIEAQITEAYAGLGDAVFVAVRSSGTAEDTAAASFAGMHDTYLDVKGSAAVVEAVQRCWASMWTARAIAYRHNQGFDHTTAVIAVVIQTMVESEVSGVMFTANPRSARTDEIVINASWGLGEAIVAGLVNPDEFTLDSATLEVKQRVPGSKEVRIRRAASGAGTVTEPVDQVDRARFSLTDDQIADVSALGRRIEQHYDSMPQDIEWALADDVFYVLQARPVTGADFRWEESVELAAQNAPETDDIVWTQRWAENYWTGGISPLFYSVRVRHYRKSIEQYLDLAGFEELKGQPYFKYHHGTAYWNCNFQKDFTNLVLPTSIRAGALDMVPQAWQQESLNRPLDFFKYVRMILSLSSSSQHSPHNWKKTQRRFIDGTVQAATAPSDETLQRMSDQELKRYAHQQEELQHEYCTSLWIGYNLIFPNVFGAMAMLLAKWYEGDDPLILQDLISGNPRQTLQQVETHEQFALAEEIRSSELFTLFEANPGEAFFQQLENSERGRQFLARYRKFIEAHGHRGAADRDIYYKRRADDPRIDYEAFVAYLKDTDPTPPWEVERKVAERREQAAREVEASLANHLFGGMLVKTFRALHQWVLDFLWIREDSRHYADRISYSKRKAFLEVARRCVERGQLAEADDCFFLTDIELYALLDGAKRARLAAAKIAARKRDFELVDSREASLPLYLRGGVAVELDSEVESDAGTLVGVGMSKGVATGRARVVPDIAEIGRVEKGDILICNATDPGWASVFTLIDGLVLETGGMLAHGACLAREHGIPALQLRSALKLVPDGAKVEIRGETGEVRLVAEEGDVPEPALATA
jgi:phosphoenolpyruvate synthase/pyruvate phosphate dikinase